MPSPLERERALVIVNPRARLASSWNWRAIALAALERRYATELAEPKDASDTTRLAHEAAALGYAVVVAAGGDGTVNAVVRGIACTRTALGILPLGTANDLAREYGVHGSIDAAARRIVEREPRVTDLGEVDGRLFCGVGGLALVDRIRIDYWDAERGERLQFETLASALFVTNHRTLGGGMVLPVDANPSDGMLEICYVPARPRHSLMLNFARLSAGTAIPPGVLVTVRTTEAIIETGRDDAFVADGELLARGRRFSVRVVPAALRLIT
jgi:diacylglycerol kinase (ATP)